MEANIIIALQWLCAFKDGRTIVHDVVNKFEATFQSLLLEDFGAESL